MTDPNESGRRILKAAIERKRLERAAGAGAGRNSARFDTSLLESRIREELDRLRGENQGQGRVAAVPNADEPPDAELLEERIRDALRMFLNNPDESEQGSVPMNLDRELIVRQVRATLLAKLGH
jgi:hypothetical protein